MHLLAEFSFHQISYKPFLNQQNLFVFETHI